MDLYVIYVYSEQSERKQHIHEPLARVQNMKLCNNNH